MRTLTPDIAEGFGIETVDLDREHVEVGNGAQDLEIAFGLGVEVEVEQDVDIRPGALADGFKMYAQVAQHLAVDIDFRRKGRAETGPPASRPAGIVSENIGLQRGELLFPDFASDRLHAVEIGDRRLVPVGMVDAPGRAMRPVDPDAIANLAAQQFVAGHTKPFCFRIEQRVFDRAKRLRNDTAGRGPRRREELRINPFVLKRVLSNHPRRETLDRSTYTRRAKTFVELAPANDAVFGGELDEVVVSPTGVAGEQFDASYFRCVAHGVSSFFDRQREPDRRPFCRHCAGHLPGSPPAKMPIAPDNFRWQSLPPNRNADASALERS